MFNPELTQVGRRGGHAVGRLHRLPQPDGAARSILTKLGFSSRAQIAAWVGT